MSKCRAIIRFWFRFWLMSVTMRNGGVLCCVLCPAHSHTARRSCFVLFWFCSDANEKSMTSHLSAKQNWMSNHESSTLLNANGNVRIFYIGYLIDKYAKEREKMYTHWKRPRHTEKKPFCYENGGGKSKKTPSKHPVHYQIRTQTIKWCILKLISNLLCLFVVCWAIGFLCLYALKKLSTASKTTTTRFGWWCMRQKDNWEKRT